MSVSKVILVGRLGRDPEARFMPNGEAATNFSTEWHNITLFGKLGEIASQYLRKGSQVFIEGKIHSRKYTGKDGIERTAYDIIGNEMKMLGSRNETAAVGNNGNSAPVATNSPSSEPNAQNQRPPPTAAPVNDIDDDIPF